MDILWRKIIMRYWYIKEPYTCRHSDFNGFRELIYRGDQFPEEFLARYQDNDDSFYKEWKKIKKYNPVYYPHTAEGMTEITEEKFKEIIK